MPQERGALTEEQKAQVTKLLDRKRIRNLSSVKRTAYLQSEVNQNTKENKGSSANQSAGAQCAISNKNKKTDCQLMVMVI
jgi:hypothetical protein